MQTEAELWEEAHRRGWGRWPNTRFVEWAGRRFKGRLEGRPMFIELGCGAGAQARFLVESGFSYWGVDQSATAIEQTKLTIERTGMIRRSPSPIQRQVGDVALTDVRRIAFPDQFADVVVDICTLQHLSYADAKAVLAKARGWLKPGGAVFSMMRMTPLPSQQRLVEAIPPRTVNAGPDLLDLFMGYHIEVGAEMINRFDGSTTTHFLIEATPNGA